MSQFYAYDFEFDSIPSHKFDLKIITFDDGSLFDGVGSASVEIITQRVLRKSVPYYLGRTQEPVLEFELTFGTARPISGMDRDMISAWLFGRSGYKNLTILQDDLNGAYFKCFLKDPVPQYIGGLNYAFKCTVVCDSPWAYSPRTVVSGSVQGGPVVGHDYHLEIYNKSSEDEYLYPTVYFYCSSTAGGPRTQTTFYIKNETDPADRTFYYNNLYAGDQITIDNDLQIVSGCDVYLNPITWALSSFNKNWLRLLPGYNYLGFQIGNTNDVALWEISYTERVKIGG